MEVKPLMTNIIYYLFNHLYLKLEVDCIVPLAVVLFLKIGPAMARSSGLGATTLKQALERVKHQTKCVYY